MDNTNQIQAPAAAAVTPMKRFNAAIASVEMQSYLASVLGEKKSSFVNNVVALVSNSSSLQQCAPLSVIYAGMKATALDLPLDPNLGFAYVIPYNNNKAGTVEAQFQIGYKGIIQLAIRSGMFSDLNVTDVREGEIKSRDILSGKISAQFADNRESLPIIGYVAYFRLTTGFEHMLYMTKAEVEAHAKTYSQTYRSKYDGVRNSSKWSTDFDAMARKTVLKLLLSRWAPLSIEMKQAIQYDQAVFNEKGDSSYADNPDEQPQPSIEERKQALRDRMNATSGMEPNKLFDEQ